MSYRELTAADFVDKSPEDIAVMVSENESGLKTSRDTWMKDANDLKLGMGEKDTAIEDARKAAVKAEELRLVDAGKYDEAKAISEAELAKLVAEANTQKESAQTMLKQRDLKDVHFDILGKVDSNLAPAAQAMLNGMTDITYGENGQPIVSIKCGDKDFSNTVDFLAHAETDATWKAMLKAPDTKGIDVHNSNAQGGGNTTGKKYSDMTLPERAAFNSN